MSVTENKAIVQRLVDEGWNGRNLQTFDALLAPNFVNHDPNNPAAADRNGLTQFVQAVWGGFPDFHVQVTDQLGEGNRVAKLWVAQGTQQGEFMGIPASGKSIRFEGTTVYDIADAKVVRVWWSYDMLGMLQQLGVVPALGPAPA